MSQFKCSEYLKENFIFFKFVFKDFDGIKEINQC